MTGIVVRELPSRVLSLVDAGFSESFYSSALSILNSHLTAQAQLSTYTIPPPSHLSLLVTMLVHPSTTDTTFRKQAAQLLSRILQVASPREAKFEEVFQVSTRKRKRRSLSSEDDGDDEEDDECELEREALMSHVDNIWDIIEFAFFKGEGGWVDLLSLIVQILKIDFIPNKTAGWTAIEKTMIYKWLRDSSGKASYTRAIQAIFATRGGEMMFDMPMEIYEESKTEAGPYPTQNDVWGGSTLLNHRIDLCTMLYDLAKVYPAFLNESNYLEALQRTLLPSKFAMDQLTLAHFLTNIQSVPFRMALCEVLAQKLSPDAVRRIDDLGHKPDLSIQLSRGYLLELPPKKGKDALNNLAKYSVITGLIFRGWMVSTYGKDRKTEGIRAAVEQAVLLRGERLRELKGCKAEVEKVLRREEVMLKCFCRQMERDCGI